MGHFCLGIIYTRGENNSINETKSHSINELKSITSVIKDIKFFLTEKWKLASDKSGSGNTANIGSINCIDDILKGNGVFSKLGEKWFDDYWMNYGRIIVSDPKTGATKKLTRLEDFIHYRKGNIKLIVKKNAKTKKVRE